MSHVTSIGASLFSDLAIAVGATSATAGYTSSDLLTIDSEATLHSYFKTEINTGAGTTLTDGKFIRITGIRSFPAIGTPPNIVKVPVYGQKTSQTIQAQADAPQLEMDLNFIPDYWASGTTLGDMVGSGDQFLFRFVLLNSEPSPTFTDSRLGTKFASVAAGTAPKGIGVVANSVYYWIGKIEALMISPSLSDATTAKLSLSIQSQFYGAYTVTTAP